MISKTEIHQIVDFVRTTSKLVLEMKEQGLDVKNKADGSFVTNVDIAVDKMLINFIKHDLKSPYPIISEEDVEAGNAPNYTDKTFWCIDPIDSTKSLIKGYNFYTINIALIHNNIPIFGLIAAPETATIWYGDLQRGAFKQVRKETPQPIHTRNIPDNGTILISSEEQLVAKEIKDNLHVITEIKMPSSLKFTYIAEGKVDYYSRVKNKACDWDIAPGHALILSAGGSVTFLHPDEDFKYGKPPYFIPSLLATGKS